MKLEELIEHWENSEPGDAIFPTHNGMLNADYAKALAGEIKALLERIDRIELILNID